MSEFKAMKFWIGDDKELSEQVQLALFGLGYDWWTNNKEINQLSFNSIYTDKKGCITQTSSIGYFEEEESEEINIGWMRTTKPETIDLNGKKWLKSDIDKAMEAAKELGELKPVD